MAGPEVTDEHEHRTAAADPASSIAFRSAVVAATRATDDVARREALRAAAGAAISLAVNGAESELRSLLTPDPVNANVTWSVACYQIGDLTPSAVRDFADAAEAVTTVSQCNDIGHVAAELVASTSMGIRWVALVRTNTTTQLRLPDADATSDSTGRHASELGDAQRRWRRRIAAWSEGTDAGIDLADGDELAAPAPATRPTRGPSRSTGERAVEPTGGGGAGIAELASLREQLRAVERQLARLDSVITGGVGHDEERAGRLHALLAEVEARLVDASLDTRSGLANVEHRLGERMASVRDTLVRGLDASATSAADTRELVDARSTAIAEALRAGVHRLGEQLTANERHLAELATGLGGVVERLDRLDEQARTNLEQVRATVRDDLAELADHLDAGHGVLDRRRERAHDELVAALTAQGGTAEAAAAQLLAAVAEHGTSTVEQIVAAVAEHGSSTAEHIVAAIAEHGTSTAEQIVAAIAEHGTSTVEEIVAAVADLRADTSSTAGEVTATVEQLRLELADRAHEASAGAADRHRRLTASLEDVRRELVNDAAITRGSIDGSLEGAAARVVRQLTAQVEHARTGSKADLAAAVIALRDEQQRERHAEERRRAGAGDAAQAALLAAVERLNQRIDRLEASQQALRESLVGP